MQPVGQSVDDGVTQVPPEHVPWPVRMPPVQTGPGPHEIAGDDGWFPFSTHTGLPVVQEIVPVLHGLVGWQAVPARQESLQAVGFLQPVGQSVDDGVTQVPPEHVPWPVRMPPVQTGPAPHSVRSPKGVQVPVEQELHSPQAVLQQKPAAQFKLMHSVPDEQLAPLSSLGLHTPFAQ